MAGTGIVLWCHPLANLVPQRPELRPQRHISHMAGTGIVHPDGWPTVLYPLTMALVSSGTTASIYGAGVNPLTMDIHQRPHQGAIILY